MKDATLAALARGAKKRHVMNVQPQADFVLAAIGGTSKRVLAVPQWEGKGGVVFVVVGDDDRVAVITKDYDGEYRQPVRIFKPVVQP